MIKFSIILPVRNGGEYIKACIQSILSQSYSFFNLIILDSGSTDGTLEYIESLKTEKIVLHKTQRPLSIEENWGRIKHVEKNEFITLIGHDDLLDSNYLEAMNELIKKHPGASLFQTHFNFIDADGKFLRVCKPMDQIQTGDEFLSMIFLNMIDVNGTGYMMRAADYDRAGGIADYPNLQFADYDLFLKLTANQYKATENKVCFSYRLHQSATRNSSDVKLHAAFSRYINFLNELSTTKPAYKTAIDRYALAFLMYYCKSFSHRLLRSSISRRPGMFVAKYIDECIEYAHLLVPGGKFDPRALSSIQVAQFIDSNVFTRRLFLIFKKIFSRPIF